MSTLYSRDAVLESWSPVKFGHFPALINLVIDWFYRNEVGTLLQRNSKIMHYLCSLLYKARLMPGYLLGAGTLYK